MNREPDVLEHNLRELLRRAHPLVEPSDAFREALCERWLTRVAPAGPGRRATARRSFALAAALLVLALGGWALAALWNAPSGDSAALRSPELVRRDGTPSAPRGDDDPATEGTATRTPVREEPPHVARLTGRVFDAASSVPVAAFEVRAQSIERPYDVAQERRLDEAPDGRFELSGATAPSVVFVRAEGYAPRRVEWTGAPLEFALERGTTLVGRVVDPQGSPVAGAQVVSERDAGTHLLSLRPDRLAWGGATTDAEGRFALRHASTGRTIVRATHAAWAAGWSSEFHSGTVDTPSSIEVALRRGGAVRGSVQRPDGRPWPGAKLMLALLDHRPAFGASAYLEIDADEQGRFLAEHLPEGSYNLLLFGDELQDEILSMRLLAVREGETEEVSFARGTGLARLHGEVRTAEGEALAGLFLTLEPARDAGRAGWRVAQTDDRGRFAFEGLEPGEYRLYSTRDQGGTVVYRGAYALGDGEARAVSVTLGSGRLRGTLRLRRTEEPVENALVVLLTRDASGETTFLARTSSGRGGSWVFEGLGPGRYRIYVLPAERTIARAIGREHVLGSGARTIEEATSLEDGGGLVLRVHDERGAPLADAAVVVRDARGDEVHEQRPMVTDAEGTLVVERLPAGTWSVTVEKPGFERFESPAWAVRPFEFETHDVTLMSRR